MATVTNLLSSATTTNSVTYTSASFGPAINDLIVVFSLGDGTVGVEKITDSRGIGFTLSTDQTYQTGANQVGLWIANALSVSTAGMTVTTSYGADAATGHIFAIAGVSGITRTGLAAVRQTVGVSNTLPQTPSMAFSVPMLTSNPGLGFVGNGTNPATLTPPVGWTEGADIGHATPTIGGEWTFIDSGSTQDIITWGSSSATEYANILVELDRSAAAPGAGFARGHRLPLLGVGA